ncbi:virulence factor family protein [Ralstonia soli]|uniref:Type IV secretion system protein VirJ n=1 Tax=Ralstonia soli TaxID=2953896 RepID=A0ABT1ALX4_9RALS|nr:AcvB/VirJ family lysyl-phosphatidylglycerol hydrolase [Ralstonia soli]MCO5399341.1 type IV secretion system protein VirJ [Ralstonia soli]
MSRQAPRPQEARHRGVLRKGRHWVAHLAAHLGAIGLALTTSWAVAADASVSAPKAAPASRLAPAPVQGPVLVPPVGMTSASGVVAVPPQGDIPPRVQMSAAAVAANKAANGGVLSLPVVAPATPAAAPGAVEFVTHGRFRDVPVYKPKGEIRSVVLMLSGDLGWTAATSRMAESLAQQGALVAGLSTPALFSSLEADQGDCAFPDGDLENFSRFLQAYEKVPGYYPPILVGDNEGGALAYAMIAQARPNIFAAAMSMEFCPVLELRKPLCKGEGVHFSRRKSESRTTAKRVKPPENAGVVLLPATKLSAPWVALQSPGTLTSFARRSGPLCEARATQTFIDTISGAQSVTLPATASGANAPPVTASEPFKSAFAKLVAQRKPPPPPPPAAVSDLPIIEVAAQPGTSSELFAVLLSGDGGWAGLDKEVAAALSKSGVPVVGIDSLRYFWSQRTPASAAADMDRLVRFYAARWKKQKALLIGYSQGADVLPFIVNRMPAASREHVALAVMMGLGKRADFEFHMTNWVSSSASGLPILPEVQKLPAGLGMCIYGQEEKDTNCPNLDPKQVRLVKLPGGHHFDGDYAKLARIILEGARANSAPAR